MEEFLKSQKFLLFQFIIEDLLRSIKVEPVSLYTEYFHFYQDLSIEMIFKPLEIINHKV